MNNIKVIRLGNILDWENSINCSIKKYNNTVNLLEFSEYIKSFFNDNDIQKEYQIKYSHCRIFNKGKEIFVEIFLQDLNYINKVLKEKNKKRIYKRYFVKYIYRSLKSKLNNFNTYSKFIINKKNYKNIFKKEYNKLIFNIKNRNYINNYKFNQLQFFLLYLLRNVNNDITKISSLKNIYKKNKIFNKYKNKKLQVLFNLKKRIFKLLNIYKIIKNYNKSFFFENFYSFQKKSLFIYRKNIYKYKFNIIFNRIIEKNIKLNLKKRIFKKLQKIIKLKRIRTNKTNKINKISVNKYFINIRKKYNKKSKLNNLSIINRFQIFQFIDFEEYLLKAGYFYFKKKINFKYYILDDYILTANSIVKYICDRLKQGFSLNEILKDVKYVLINSKDIIGFRIDCAGRFGRKQRTSFKRLSLGNLSKSKINAIVDYNMNFVILKYGCCNIKVLLHKKKGYREYKYKLKIY